MTRSELIEAMARASYENTRTLYGGPWKSMRLADRASLLADMEAALSAIEQAGFVCVDKEAVDDLTTRAATWSNNGRKAWVNTPLVELRALEAGRLK